MFGNQEGLLMIFFQICIQQSSELFFYKKLIFSMFFIPFDGLTPEFSYI